MLRTDGTQIFTMGKAQVSNRSLRASLIPDDDCLYVGMRQIFFDPIFYLLVYAISKFKRKKQFFMVPIVHDIIQVQALVWVSVHGVITLRAKLRRSVL